MTWLFVVMPEFQEVRQQRTQRTDPQEALKVLDVNRHFPNLLIVKHGSVILNKPEMVDLIYDFHSRVHKAQEKDLSDLSMSSFQ